MSNVIDDGTGPGWHNTDTPYGTIHHYTDPGTGYDGSEGHSGDHTVGAVGPNTNISVQGSNANDSAFLSMCTTNLKKHEGFKNTMYLDSEHNVTVGIGHLLSSVGAAQALPFDRTQHLSRGHGDSEDIERSATAGEIASAFNATKANPKAITGIHLSDGAVIGQCVQDVRTTETGLRSLYSGYDNFPNHAKTALVDMGFNMGIGKLKSEFPNFNAAVNRNDWNGAANESHRTGISQDRNNDTAAQLREAINGH